MVEKLNILTFAPLYPPHIGGLESHTHRFNINMGREGHNITVFTPHIVKQSPFTEEEENVRVIRFPAWQPIENYYIPALTSRKFWSAWKRLRSDPIDIVISRTRFFTTSLLAARYSRKKRIPWIHIEHGSDHMHSRHSWLEGAGKILDNTLGRYVFKSADHLVANSYSSAKFVKRYAPERIVQVTHRGIEKEKIQAIAPNSTIHKNHKDETVILYAGRLISGKGVHDLITAVTALPTESYHLYIIGTGPDEKKLKQQAINSRLQKSVTFTGSLPWEKVIAAMKSSAILVNPSYSEGLPTTVIEGALCECGLIATDVGGTGDIVKAGETGILITPGNTSELTAALQLLIQNPALQQKLAEAAYNQTVKKFSWKKNTEQYLDLFASIVRK